MRQLLPLIDNHLNFFVKITYFWRFVKTFFLKTLDTQNILATTERVSIGASLRIIKIGFQFYLCLSIGFGVGS
jgi:hypothetical protein